MLKFCFFQLVEKINRATVLKNWKWHACAFTNEVWYCIWLMEWREWPLCSFICLLWWKWQRSFSFTCISANTWLRRFNWERLPSYDCCTQRVHHLYTRVLSEKSRNVNFSRRDNCSTNKALATQYGVSLVGCGSHQLNLAVKRFLEPNEPILKKINDLMTKLSSIKQAAKLRCSTNLQPIKLNVTRWSSTFTMLKRFFELEEHLDMRDTELTAHIPTRREDQDLRNVLLDLKVFESVSKKLQQEEFDLLVQQKLLTP